MNRRALLFSDWSIVTKVIIVSFLIVVSVGGIVIVNLLSFRQLNRLLITILDRDVAQVVDNARLGRELGQVFANVNLLINTFIERQAFLEQEGKRLLEVLDRNRTTFLASNIPELQDALQKFTNTLQLLLNHCAVINRMSGDLGSIHAEIDHKLTVLEDAVAEKTIMLAVEGKKDESFAVEQLGTMLPGYRAIFYQITIQVAYVKQAYLGVGTGEIEQERYIVGLLDELSINLTAASMAGQDILALGQQTIEEVVQYKERILEFYQSMKEFQDRVKEVNNARDVVLIEMGKNDERVVQTTQHIRDSVVSVIQASNQVIIALSGLVVIVLMLAVFYVVKTIRPIGRLAKVAEQLAEGDIACDIFEAKTSDEIGTLARAFGKLIGYIQDMAHAATEIAGGNLSKDVQPRSAHDVLGQAFKNMSSYLKEMATVATTIAAGDLHREILPRTKDDVLGNAFQQMKDLRQSMREIMYGSVQLHQASEELKSISVQMAVAIEQTSQRTQVVSESSQQISENVDAVATATEEMSANVREISKNVAQVAQLAIIVAEMATSANDTISDLERHSQEIGDVINIITAVTQQTNLLALNATIEAARAGEMGKGFTVVAHEIKELSRETATSAEHIIRKLEAIRSRSKDATKAINEIAGFINQIRDLSNSTASGVEEQSVTTNEIAHRMTEAAQGSQDITSVIAEVASMAQQTSAGASNVQNAAEYLASLAGQLQQLVGRFKI